MVHCSQPKKTIIYIEKIKKFSGKGILLIHEISLQNFRKVFFFFFFEDITLISLGDSVYIIWW